MIPWHSDSILEGKAMAGKHVQPVFLISMSVMRGFRKPAILSRR
jgi:hypothetical protein